MFEVLVFNAMLVLFQVIKKKYIHIYVFFRSTEIMLCTLTFFSNVCSLLCSLGFVPYLLLLGLSIF